MAQRHKDRGPGALAGVAASFVGIAAILGVVGAIEESGTAHDALGNWWIRAALAVAAIGAVFTVGAIVGMVRGSRGPRASRLTDKDVTVKPYVLGGDVFLEVTNTGRAEADFEAEQRGILTPLTKPYVAIPRPWPLQWQGESGVRRASLIPKQMKRIHVLTHDHSALYELQRGDPSPHLQWHLHQAGGLDDISFTVDLAEEEGKPDVWMGGYATIYRVDPPGSRAFFLRIEMNVGEDGIPRLTADVRPVSKTKLRRKIRKAVGGWLSRVAKRVSP